MSAPAINGNHDAWVVGTTVTALAYHSLMCANTIPTKDGCGNSSESFLGRAGYVTHVVVTYVCAAGTFSMPTSYQ